MAYLTRKRGTRKQIGQHFPITQKKKLPPRIRIKRGGKVTREIISKIRNYASELGYNKKLNIKIEDMPSGVFARAIPPNTIIISSAINNQNLETTVKHEIGHLIDYSSPATKWRRRAPQADFDTLEGIKKAEKYRAKEALRSEVAATKHAVAHLKTLEQKKASARSIGWASREYKEAKEESEKALEKYVKAGILTKSGGKINQPSIEFMCVTTFNRNYKRNRTRQLNLNKELIKKGFVTKLSTYIGKMHTEHSLKVNTNNRIKDIIEIAKKHKVKPDFLINEKNQTILIKRK